MSRLVVWRGTDEWRAEATRLDLRSDSLSASGTQIGDEPGAYRLDYRLETGDGFVTRVLEVEASDRRLALERTDDGRWTSNCEPLDGFDESLDCDLGRSPLTNAMPILRHRLHRSPGSEEFTMAWVAVPELTVVAERQRYTHLRPGLVRFESLDGQFAGFTADLELDDDGLVIRYPELAERVRD